MTTPLDADWAPRARGLADLLTENGDLHDPAWHNAVAAVARHVLVPAAYEQDGFGAWQPVDVASPAGLDAVYSPVTLITALADRGTHHESVSSSSKPDLMLRMLEVLDVHDGHKVLEIGTGTGYKLRAALPSARRVNAGNLALLHRYPDRLEGRFIRRWASFMTMRHHHDEAGDPRLPRSPHTRHRIRLTVTPAAKTSGSTARTERPGSSRPGGPDRIGSRGLQRVGPGTGAGAGRRRR